MRYMIDISIFCLGLLVMYGVMALESRADRQAGMFNIPLYPIVEIQRELNARGHSLKEDGIWGKNSDLALTMEVSK